MKKLPLVQVFCFAARFAAWHSPENALMRMTRPSR